MAGVTCAWSHDYTRYRAREALAVCAGTYTRLLSKPAPPRRLAAEEGGLPGRWVPCRPEHCLCAEPPDVLSGEPGIGGGAVGEAARSSTPLWDWRLHVLTRCRRLSFGFVSATLANAMLLTIDEACTFDTRKKVRNS